MTVVVLNSRQLNRATTTSRETKIILQLGRIVVVDELDMCCISSGCE